MQIQAGTPAETEDGATLLLTLTTLAGEEIQLLNNWEHDRLDELEDAVVDCLPAVSQIFCTGGAAMRAENVQVSLRYL